MCFLCQHNIGGWEEDDNPLHEHLRFARNCGWAITAAIEADIGDLGKDDPSSSEMIEARKSTFSTKWPHEGKRGWKCKTKQVRTGLGLMRWLQLTLDLAGRRWMEIYTYPGVR